MKTIVLLFVTLLSSMSFGQSDLENTLKGGELILSGLSIFKAARSNPKSDSKTVESICVKNKIDSRITFRISGKDEEQNDIKRELVIPKEGKECLLQVPKGIYTYEITKPDNEVYKKGEYKLEEPITIVIKDQ